jgi:hypothetical protein
MHPELRWILRYFDWLQDAPKISFVLESAAGAGNHQAPFQTK